MTPKRWFFYLSFVFSLIVYQVSAQRSNEVPEKAIESIIGKWQLQKVYAGSREITANPNSENRSWIEFNADGTYNQQSEDTDRGSYRLNENHSVLYLESEERKETSSAVSSNNLTEYDISIRNGMLTMQPRGDDSTRTKYVYVKSGGGE